MLLIIKYCLLLMIIIISTYIGISYSKSYSMRVEELEDIKNALSIFKSKIKYTLLPISEVFYEIGKDLNNSIGKIFLDVSKDMEDDNITDAWHKELKDCKQNTSLNTEDVNILMKLSTMLGNVDIEGQISNINLVIELIEKQIESARYEQIKNSKLYKTLGTGVGLTIAIILI